MIDCDKIREILPAYLEGLSPQSESEMVSSHLASCHECSSTVKALMQSQKLIANLGEVEPPPWLKTRIMARMEEGVEQEEEKRWSVRRLINLLLYPLKVKIPIQAFAVLLVAVAVFYVYRTIQPDMQPPGETLRTAPAIPEEKHDSLRKSEEPKAQERSVTKNEPQPSAKEISEEGEKWPTGVREIFNNSRSSQASLPSAPQSPQEIKKDGDLQAAAEPEGKKTRAAKAAPPGASGTPYAPALEGQARSDGRAEMEKGNSAIAAMRPETITITLHVNDIKMASNDVETVLRALNAPASRQSREGSNLISTEVPAQKAREIVRRLNEVGQVHQRGQFPSDTASDKPVSVRIQILQKQP